MAIDIVNGSDSDITNFGGGTDDPPKRSYTASAAGTTSAQAGTGIAANGSTAVLKGGSTATQKAQVASAILDDLVSSIDLSTPALRKGLQLKAGLAEYVDILAQLAL